MSSRTVKALCILLALASAAALCACGESHNNVGDESTVALDAVFTAVLSGDDGLYKTAFPPDYISEVASAFQSINEDVDKKLADDMDAAKDAIAANYGDDAYTCYTLLSKKPSDTDLLYEDYHDYYAAGYKIAQGSVSEAYDVTVLVATGGDDGNSENTAVFTVIKIAGKWYLHPKYFLYMPQ